jgi:FAD/FMN-containing dehydrogenase
VLPADTAQVAAVMRACADAGCGRAPGRQHRPVRRRHAAGDGAAVVVNLSRLRRIRAWMPPTTRSPSRPASAGGVQAAARGRPAVPLALASEGSCEVGGVISTNAGGVQVLRYGNTRELVLGLEVVLPDGQIWDGLRALRKDNTGYDLKQLFIGAEGTLGIVTAATLKLFARPRAASPPGWRWPPAAAVELLGRLRAVVGDRVTAFELISRRPSSSSQHIPGTRDPGQPPWYVLLEPATPAPATPGRRCSRPSRHHRRARHRRRHRHQRQPGPGPLAAAREHLRSPEARRHQHQARHLGAGQRDPRLPRRGRRCPRCRLPGPAHRVLRPPGRRQPALQPVPPVRGENDEFIARTPEVNRIVYDQVVERGGSISAEHGIGQLSAISCPTTNRPSKST